MASPVRQAAPAYRAVRRFPRILNLPAIQGNLTAGKSPKFDMDLGVTYLAIALRFTIAGVAATQAQVVAQVAHLRATIDGDDKMSNATPLELLDVENFWYAGRIGQAVFVDGTLMIFLTRPFEQTIDAQDGPGWGCATGPNGVSRFTLEVELAGAGITIDDISGWAEIDDAAPLGRHWCLRRYPVNQAAAGEFVFNDWIPRTDKGVYAFHIDKACTPENGALITDMRLYVDQADDYVKVPLGAVEAVQRRYGLTKQTAKTQIAFDRRGRPLDALPLIAQNMRLSLFTTGALGNFNILAECMEGVEPDAAGAAG